jgi:hypothetical protein
MKKVEYEEKIVRAEEIITPVVEWEEGERDEKKANFTDEEVLCLKEKNDWGKEFDETKCMPKINIGWHKNTIKAMNAVYESIATGKAVKL